MASKYKGRAPFIMPRALRLKDGVNIETISGAVTMTPASSTFQRLDGGAGDRTLTLPAVTDYETNGLFFEFYNAGSTNDLIIADAGGTVKTLTPGSWARLASEGTDWYVMDSTSAGTTDLGDSTALNFGDANDITMQWDGTRFLVGQATANSEIRWGVDGAGLDQIWYGDTASTNMTWDQSADSLIFTDAAKLVFGTGSDISVNFDGTNLVVATAVADTGAVEFGADDAGVDVVLYGDTASESMTWDQSADDMIMTAAVRIVGQGSTVVPLIPIAAQQDLSGPGAVTITEYYTAVTTTGADALTLADGAQVGQLKKIQLVVDGGDGTLTPTSLSGGTTITFADAGDYVILCWDGTNWVAVELGNDADGATAPVLA